MGSSPTFGSMFNLPKEIVIWDSEWTCWPGSEKRAWTGTNESRELVQIGAVRVRTADLVELDNFEVFIKPTVRPVLSDYFVKLTGITQGEVDEKGKPFEKACQMFFDWAGPANLYSWKMLDFWTLVENCQLAHIVLPVPANRFSDIRIVFWKRGIAAENYQSSTIVKAFKQKPKYQRHNALNDARIVLDGLRALSKKLA